MRKYSLRSAEVMKKEKRRQRGWNKVFTMLACVVVFCTAYALVLPAITMTPEKRLVCTEASLSGHVHTKSCRGESGDYVCGYADFVLHTHEENCFDAKGGLICQLEEITEQTSAPEAAPKTAPETAGETDGESAEETTGVQELGYTVQSTGALTAHTHTDECFGEDGKPVCGAVQLLRHQHTENCFEDVVPEEEELHPGTEDTVRQLSAQGADYTVTVSFTKEAGLPENVELSVREILPESEEFAGYYEQTADLLPEDRGLFFCRFFDVSFLADGVKTEPLASVDVQISYAEPVPQDDSLTCTAVHFAEDGVEVLPAEILENEKGEDTIAFSQESFSVVGTAISALKLDKNSSYIFYKDGYAIGANAYGPVSVEVTVDENGYVSPANTGYPIEMITWTYQNGGLYNQMTKKYLVLSNSLSMSASRSLIDARIINNAVRFSRTVSSGSNGTYYLGLDSTVPQLTVGTLFANGEYFLAAKVTNVSDVEIEPGALEIADNIRKTGNLLPQLNDSTAAAVKDHTLQYVWYRSDDNGTSWKEVERRKITGESYNMAEDGSWLNAALDKGANTLYKVAIQTIDGKQTSEKIESRPYLVPYFDSIQNGDFEEPAISTDVSDAEHYQPLLPNGTAGMVWKTTASDNKVEFISVASDAFQNYSYLWHNCESAASGVQYVELNATSAGALYQDVLTIPGSTMYWSLAHRGRGTTAMRGGSTEARDTMYVLVMSAVMADELNITTPDKVQDVIDHPENYPGASVTSITDDNFKWYYHTDEKGYEVPKGQYLTRYFFVAGETAFDRVQSKEAAPYTAGNHLDDVHFSTELPPPTAGKVNLEVKKTICGLEEEKASAILQQLTFTIDGQTVKGSDFKNFSWNGEDGFTATYQVQLDIGTVASKTVSAQETLSSAVLDGYDCTTTVSVNSNRPTTADSASVTIRDKGTGSIAFTNTYEAQTTALALYKVGGSGQPLSGAVFSLESFDGTQWQSTVQRIAVDSAGYALLDDLRYSVRYRLTETAAPNGYHPLTAPIYFMIVSDNGKPALHPCDADGTELQDWPDQVKVRSGDALALEIINQSGLVLPDTGGVGTPPVYLAGLCLLTASVTLFGFIRKRAKGGLAKSS